MLYGVKQFSLVVLALFTISAQAADLSTPVVGAMETETRFQVTQTQVFQLQSPSWDGDDQAWGLAVFQKGARIRREATNEQEAFCQLFVSADRDATNVVLPAGSVLEVFSFTAKRFRDAKELEITFDRETSALPLYNLRCIFPGKLGLAVTLGELQMVLGASLKPLL